MKTFWICLCALFVAPCPASAQSQNPITIRPLAKSEKIDVAIELLYRLKDAVAQSHREGSGEAYKRIAIQAFKCAMLYGMLSKSPPPNGPNSVTYSNVSDVFNYVSGFLYPDALAKYQIDTLAARDELLEVRKNNEKQKMFYLLRNCSELAEGQGKVLANAIGELMIK